MKKTKTFRSDGSEVLIKVDDIDLLNVCYGKAKNFVITAEENDWEYLSVTVIKYGECSYEWEANMEVVQDHPEYGYSVYGCSEISPNEDGLSVVSVRQALPILSARTRAKMLLDTDLLLALRRCYTELFNAWDSYMAINW